MLHFFRKIRHDLIANSKFHKYLKYAIGEVILVMLGILMALYINNWNELRKEREKFNQTLVEVEQEIAYNIAMSKYCIELFVKRDSSYQKLLVDSLKFKDYTHYNSFFSLPIRWSVMDDSFKKLNQNIVLTKEQESILGQLKWLNNDQRKHVNHYGDYMVDLQNDYKELVENYDWYNSWAFDNLDDVRIIDFFQNDPEYFKMALKDFQLLSEFRVFMQTYEREALSIYNNIYNYLNSIGVKHIDTLLFQYDPKEYKHYIGKYDAIWCSDKSFIFDDSIFVSIENEQFIYTSYSSNRGKYRKEIIPVNKYHFRDEADQGIYHLEFDEGGEVEGIRFSLGPKWIYSMKKVR